VLASTLGIILSGGTGAFFGTAGGEICNKAWEESKAIRANLSYGQMTVGVIAVASIALLTVGAGALFLRWLGYSNSQILLLAGSALGDMAGVGIAFLIPYMAGLGIRKFANYLRGPAPKLTEEYFQTWNGQLTKEEREAAKLTMVQAIDDLPEPVAEKVRAGLKERKIDLDQVTETPEERIAWLSCHPAEMAALIVAKS
jgi:hypothetical protein